VTLLLFGKNAAHGSDHHGNDTRGVLDRCVQMRGDCSHEPIDSERRDCALVVNHAPLNEGA